MATHLFLGFIGSLLACAIALAVVVKNLAEGIAISGKKPFVTGSLSALITSLVAFFASYVSENPFVLFWFLGAVFLLFGIIHVLFLHKRYFYAHKGNSNKVLIAELLFGLTLILFTVVVFSVLQYYLKKDKDFLFYPIVVSTLLFFVPVLVYHSFQAAYAIPPAQFPTWQYPLHKPPLPPENDRNERILVIGFELRKKATDTRKTYFRVRAPETWQLGELFYCFIDEHNDPNNQTIIEYTDAQYEPYEWWFYKKRKWYQAPKILIPAFSVRENGISENDIIICERNLSPPPVSNTNNK